MLFLFQSFLLGRVDGLSDEESDKSSGGERQCAKEDGAEGGGLIGLEGDLLGGAVLIKDGNAPDAVDGGRMLQALQEVDGGTRGKDIALGLDLDLDTALILHEDPQAADAKRFVRGVKKAAGDKAGIVCVVSEDGFYRA